MRVFLSHNSQDKAAVEEIGRRLRAEGVDCWLDKWNLVAGTTWVRALDQALAACDTGAIFFGPDGDGPWHREEVDVLLDRAARAAGAKDDFRAIPVLLPGANAERVNSFLRQRTWVDFRAGLDDTEAFRRLVAGIRGEAIESGDGYRLDPAEPPYRGLEPFEKEQQGFFFGRDAEIRKLVERLEGQPFVAVVGASGSGKSSLTRAGLHTPLARETWRDLAAWKVLTVLPGGDPLRSLAEQLAAGQSAGDRLRLIDELTVRFRQRTDGLRSAITGLFPGDQDRFLLLIDQFEETFTQHSDLRDSHGAWRETASRFIANLADAADHGRERLRILITLRSDFIHRCHEFPELRRLLEYPQLLLGPLSRDALRECVALPAKKVGAFFEKGLVEAILKDAGDELGSLPLLQQALKELWNARQGPWLTHEAYARTGGVTGALQRRADATYRKLQSAGVDQLARGICLRLTTFGEGVSDTRRRAAREELYPKGVDKALVDNVISQLSHEEARLIVVNDDGTVEFTHEAILQRWEILRGWLESDRARARLHRRLTEATREWDENHRDESYLPEGGRLEDAEELATDSGTELNRLEHEFLAAGIAKRKRLRTEEQERHRRELDQAQALADVQRRRAEDEERTTRELQRRALIQNRLLKALGVALGVAIIAAIIAWSLKQTADEQRELAVARETAARARAAFRPNDAALLESLELAVHSLKTAWTFEGHEAWVTGMQRLGVPPEPTVSFRMAADTEASSFSRDGEWLALGGLGVAGVYEVTTGRELHSFDWPGRVLSVAFSDDRQRLAIATEHQPARVYETASWTAVATNIVRSNDYARALAYLPGGRRLLAAYSDELAVWDESTDKEEVFLRTGSATALTVSGGGYALAAGQLGGTIRFWPLETNETGQVVPGRETKANWLAHSERVTSLAFSRGEKFLWTTSEDGVARCSSFDTEDEAATLVFGEWSEELQDSGSMLSHLLPWKSVAMDPRSDRALLSRKRSHRAWAKSEHPGCASYRLRSDPGVADLAFSPDARRLATLTTNGIVQVHEPGSGVERRMTSDGSARSIAFREDGRLLVLGGQKGLEIVVNDETTGQTLGRIDLALEEAAIAQLTPRGRWAILVPVRERATNYALTLVNTTTGTRRQIPVPGILDGVAISQDEQWLTIDAITVMLPGTRGERREVAKLFFDSSTGNDSPAPKSAAWTRLYPVEEPESSVEAGGRPWSAQSIDQLTLTIDGRMLVLDPIDIPQALAFSDDGRWLAAGYADGGVRIYPLKCEDMIALACSRLTPSLSAEAWSQTFGGLPYCSEFTNRTAGASSR